MIIIAGTVDIDPARREEALKGAKPYIDGALTQEGCLAYAWTADPEMPGRIHVFEEWTDAEALAQHFNDRHYAEMRAHMGQFDIRAAVTHKYRFDAKAPVYDETGTATADFPE